MTASFAIKTFSKNRTVEVGSRSGRIDKSQCFSHALLFL